MAGLQRSAVSFRRQGSSGFVWDDRFLSGELSKVNQEEEHQEQGQTEHEKGEIKEVNAEGATAGSTYTTERSHSNGGGGRGYRTGKVSPAIDPPSPKLSACGFCGAFGKTREKGQRSKRVKHRSR